MYLATPTRAFLSASKEEEYNIFFFTLASSGHQDIKNSFSFLPYKFKICLRTNNWRKIFNISLLLGCLGTGGCTRSRTSRSDSPSLHWPRQSSGAPKTPHRKNHGFLQSKWKLSKEVVQCVGIITYLLLRHRWISRLWWRRQHSGSPSWS